MIALLVLPGIVLTIMISYLKNGLTLKTINYINLLNIDRIPDTVCLVFAFAFFSFRYVYIANPLNIILTQITLAICWNPSLN